MSDSRIYLAGSVAHLAKNNNSARDHSSLDAAKESQAGERTSPPEAERYFVTSPSGTKLHIPKELYVALADFMKTRKCPGSITIQFRRGEIVCVEAVAKKTYRGR